VPALHDAWYLESAFLGHFLQLPLCWQLTQLLVVASRRSVQSGEASAPSAVEVALQKNDTAPNYWNPLEKGYQNKTIEQGIVIGIFGCLLLLAFLIFFIIRLCCMCRGKVCLLPSSPQC
jgi:hypothetical protein